MEVLSEVCAYLFIVLNELKTFPIRDWFYLCREGRRK